MYYFAVGLIWKNASVCCVVTILGGDPAIDPLGKVYRPSYDTENINVALTVIAFVGSVSEIKKFDVTILAKEPTNQQAVDDAYADLTASLIKGVNSDIDNITMDLNLPSDMLQDVLVSWDISDKNIVSMTGRVTRSPFSSGSQIVTLIASLIKGSVPESLINTRLQSSNKILNP